MRIKIDLNRSRAITIFLLNGIWVLPSILVLILIQIIIPIRFHGIYALNLGHFILDGAEEIFNFKKKNKRELRLFYFINPKRVSNNQWALMIKREIPVYEFYAFYMGKWLGLLFKDKLLHSRGTSIRDMKNSRFLKDTKVEDDFSIKFTSAENETGMNWLRSKGWKIGEPFVCLLVRDSAFDEKSRRHNKLSTLSYRNSKIDVFKSSIEWLTSQKIWVIRMGTVSKETFNLRSNYFIDYSSCLEQSDFLDIWLFSNCTGIISTSSGPDALACLYKIPLLLVDMLPLNGLYSFSKSITVPRSLYFKDNQKELNLTETLDLSFSTRYLPNYYLNSDDIDYEVSRIGIRSLTENEILFAVKEFWLRLNLNWEESISNTERQKEFWRIFTNHKYFHINHHMIHPEAFIGSDWLNSKDINFFS